MRTSKLLSPLLLSTLAATADVSDSSSSESSIYSSDFSSESSSHIRSSSSSSHSSTLTKEDSPFPTIQIYAPDEDVWFADVAMGTPPQYQALRVDIAQPYLWFLNASAYSECAPTTTDDSDSTASDSSTSSATTTATGYTNDCEYYGAYNVSNSSSAEKYDNSYGQYLFMDYVYVNGSIVNDDLTLFNISTKNGTLSIPQADFLLANESSVVVGALGLGGNIGIDTTNYSYHILDELVDHGYINSSAYSLAPRTNTTGSLIFGGVDTDLFIEPLVQFANIPYQYRADDVRYDYPIVPLTGVSVMNDKGVEVLLSDSDDARPVLLDTRTTFLYLPIATVISMAVQLNAYYSATNALWLLKCSVSDIDAKLCFQFGNLTIDIALDRLITNITADDDTPVTFEDGSEACALKVLPDTYFGYSVIGMPVLQDTYIAVDNDGHNIAMAQANNEMYKSRMANKTTTSTSASSTQSLPYASSEISSGYIPFAVGNNITDSLVFSYSYAPVTESAYQGMTAVFTSGVVYTGRYINSTSSQASSTSGTSSERGAAGLAHGDGLVVGVLGTFICLCVGFVL